MKIPFLFLAALTLPLSISPVQAQSWAAQLRTAAGQAVSNTLTKRSGGQPPLAGNHGEWNNADFAPPTMDGYTHLRFGSSSNDQFGNAHMGRDVCDREYVGYALLQRATLTPRDAYRCVSVERANDPSASEETVRERMAQLSGTRKFYTRGTAQVMMFDPQGRQLPPGKALVEFGFGGGSPIVGPEGINFRITGPHWLVPGSPPGQLAEGFAMLIDADPAMKMRWQQMGTHSYVYFTVGTPTNKRPAVMQRNLVIYDLPVTVDKIVLTDGHDQIVLTP
jgi:hypothetical protein